MESYRSSIRVEILPQHGIFENELALEDLKDFDKGVVARVLARALKGSHKTTFYVLYACTEDWEEAGKKLSKLGVRLNQKSLQQYASEARSDILLDIKKSPELTEWLINLKKKKPAIGKFGTP